MAADQVWQQFGVVAMLEEKGHKGPQFWLARLVHAFAQRQKILDNGDMQEFLYGQPRVPCVAVCEPDKPWRVLGGRW